MIHQRFIQRGQGEERTDAVGNQDKAAAVLAQSGKKGREFLPGLPWGLGEVIKSDHLTVRKQGLVVRGFLRRAALSVDIYHDIVHIDTP